MFKVWKPHLFKSQFNDFLLKLELVFCFKIWFNFLFILFSFLCIFCSKYLFILFFFGCFWCRYWAIPKNSSEYQFSRYDSWHFCCYASTSHSIHDCKVPIKIEECENDKHPSALHKFYAIKGGTMLYQAFRERSLS